MEFAIFSSSVFNIGSTEGIKDLLSYVTVSLNKKEEE